MEYIDEKYIVKGMFDSLIKLKDEEWDVLKEHLHKVEYKKNEVITHAGNIENYLYFIVRGVIRYYFYSDSSRDHTLGFRTSPAGFCAYTSFITRKPSSVGSQAMSRVLAYRVSYDELERLYVEMDRIERLSRMFLQLAYVDKEEKEFNLMSKTASGFYQDFCCKFPQIIESVPQKYIASYMGIAPESLSRIKREINKNKC